jgi:uncharacterized Fe-S radical SAM superfamily protein PflX
MRLPAENINSFSPAVQRLWAMMNPCVICPRNCRVNRSPSATLGTGKGELGFCGIADYRPCFKADEHPKINRGLPPKKSKRSANTPSKKAST